jgi:uncharacterized protein (TIGR02391 family)
LGEVLPLEQRKVQNLKLSDVISDADALCAFEPEELGLLMLPVLASWPRFQDLQLSTFIASVKGTIQEPGQFPPDRSTEVELAIREAWAWLEGAALLVQDPRYGHSVKTLSRRARKLANEPDPRRVRGVNRILKDSLHPKIRDDVWALYHRGKYDTAVFEAMKAVEVAVREAAGLAPADIGNDLMRRAFAVGGGPLTDAAAQPAERQARSDLFAGAIGSYKNPHSHRKVALDNPDEAAEIIMLANHLLRIVDVRKPVLADA